jgi:hypothetical protein
MMITGSLPAWNGTGVLPPIRPGVLGNSPDRSPYKVDLVAFVDKFSSSPERKKILDGFLRFRGELHRLGIISGFQWVDGSFLENIEAQENRPPKDMDVVTFYDIPRGESQQSLALKGPNVFNWSNVKTAYSIDGYFSSLSGRLDLTAIKNISYWYSMWSHRRDGVWKGFAQIDLAPTHDHDARMLLNDGGNK